MDDIIDMLAAEGMFTAFIAIARRSGVESILRGAGPLTLFVPPDPAFSPLPPVHERVFMLNHMVSGRYTAADLMSLDALPALSGIILPVSAAEGLQVGGVFITRADIEAANGLIHVIEQPLVAA